MSNTAFDTHRVGDHRWTEGKTYSPKVHGNATGPRRCVDAIDSPRFELVTVAGTCDMYAHTAAGVRVWKLAQTPHRADSTPLEGERVRMVRGAEIGEISGVGQ